MKTLLFAPVASLLATQAGAQQAVPPAISYGTPIKIVDAMALVQRAMTRSSSKGLRMAIAIVEPSGELVAFARHDDSPYASIRLAQQKARTAARLRISTMTLEERVLAGRTVLLSSDEVIAIGGGVPIVDGGRIIGAIGVSGGTAAQDAEIANGAIAAE